VLLTLYDSNKEKKAVLAPSDSSVQDKALQSDNVLSLSLSHYDCIVLEVNDYVEFLGERYWVAERYCPKQKSAREWVYDVKLYGIESLIKRFLVIKSTDGDNDVEFTLTAPASEQVALIVRAINDGMGTSDWKVGTVVATENLVVDYEGTYCDEGLKKVAELAETEYWIEGTTVNVCRWKHGRTTRSTRRSLNWRWKSLGLWGCLWETTPCSLKGSTTFGWIPRLTHSAQTRSYLSACLRPMRTRSQSLLSRLAPTTASGLSTLRNKGRS
jgi:hypothetical protein